MGMREFCWDWGLEFDISRPGDHRFIGRNVCALSTVVVCIYSESIYPCRKSHLLESSSSCKKYKQARTHLHAHGFSFSFFAHLQNCGKLLLASLFLSVCLSTRNNSAPTRRIFMKFSIWGFSKVCR